MAKKVYDTQDEGERKRAYGMSYNDLKELRHAQVHGEMKMVTCNGDPKEQIPAHEADHVYLLRTEALFFDELTGEKLSSPRYEKYNIPVFKNMQKINAFRGKKVEILHDPTLAPEPKAAPKKAAAKPAPKAAAKTKAKPKTK